MRMAEHPVTAQLLKRGEYTPFPAAECMRCGNAAEVFRRGECLCRQCALELWQCLPESRQLELLGFERL